MGFTFEAVSARRPVGHGHDPDAPLVAYRFEVYAAKGSERTYVEPARAPHGEASPYGEIFLGPLARRVEKLSNNGKELAATCGR